MGLFDFFKKKSSDEETPIEDDGKIVVETENTDDSTPGWHAIDAEFNRLYPDQPNPLHYGTVIKYMLGGPDPLDGISVYDAGDFWHFVSYGLSELYTKESDDPEYSGYGIELTFKLKKSNNDEEEIKNGCGLLQYVARYIFQTGKVVLPEEYIYTKQTVGIDAQQKSSLTGFLTAADDLAKPLDTKKGTKMTKRALISVSDKAGIVEFAQELKKLGWDIISTGGTKVVLDNAGVETIAIDDVTGFPEMMDGRVKTLHPNIHGGLLARRDLDSHLQAAKDNQIELIDLVVVNLYPFKETILKPDVTYADAVENIDIGGPSMLRSAAKNHASVTVVVDPADYAVVLDELAANGETSYETRQRLAAKVFRHTAAYDALIAEYFTAQVGESKPEKLTLTYDLKQAMRYGENPQQDADFYQKALPTDYSIASAKQLNGKELSFNNIRDADAAIRIIRDFKDRPTVVALKHMNPCGIGQADDIETAWDYAYESDPVSIFGGIVVLNREVDAATAEKMHGVFLEIIIAPSYTDEALAILTNKKKNLRILALPFDAQDASEVEAEYTGVVGGLLVQNQDVVKESPADWQVVTKRQPTEIEATALEFAWKAIKYVKSNGIIVTNDHMTLGVGPGQTNRVASVRIAIDQAKERLDGAVLASDAFFPFADNVEEIAKAGIKAIIQPGGSVRDQESIEAADKYGLTMVFTGVRHFRH